MTWVGVHSNKHLPSLAKFCGSTSSKKEDGEGGSTFLRPVWVYRKLCTRLHTWVEVRAKWPRAAWSSSKKIMWQSSVGRKTNNPKLWCSSGTVSCDTNDRTPVSSSSHSGTTWRFKLLLALAIHNLLRFLPSFFAEVGAALLWGTLDLNAIPLVLVCSIFEDEYSNSLSLLQSEVIPSQAQKYGVQHPLFLLSFHRYNFSPDSAFSIHHLNSCRCSWWLPPWLPPKKRWRRHFPSKRRAEIRSVHVFFSLS